MNIHPNFSYNGRSMAVEEWKTLLNEMAQSSESWEQSHARFMLNWLDSSDSIEVQTSGSTGAPKTMKVLKSAMAASALMTAQYFQCFENTRALLVLPSSFIAGKMMLVRAMTQGWKLTAVEPVSQPLGHITQAFDFAAFTPMQLSGLTEKQLQLLSTFGTVIVGGAALPEKVRQSLEGCSGNLYETYGMAETLSHVAIRSIGSAEEAFKALPGVTFTADEAGRLRIDAPHLSNETYQSRDVVRIISNTSFAYCGRYDRVINSGGIKLFAEAIEQKISTLIELPFYVTSHPDEALGQRVVLYVETERAMDPDEWREKLRTVLDKFEVPKEIISLKTLERTPSGKIIFNS
ncbi:MAG: AMP-binding protein [Flavobacteriales bacterium]